MSMDEPERMRIERVAASISSPVLHAHDAAAAGVQEAGVEEALADAAETGRRTAWSAPGSGRLAWLLPAAAALGIGTSFASGDPRVGLVVGASIVFVPLLQAVDRRVSFSFGEGFVGYRSDMGWPRGVQEDDDFRWAWRPANRTSRR